MSKCPAGLWSCLLFALLLASLQAPEIRAQYAQAPDAYSVTEVNSMFGPAVNMQIQRDGSKVMVDSSHAALPGGQPSHLRTLYDLEAHRSFTWDMVNSSVPCGAATFSGDWGDPFAMSAEMNADLSKSQGNPVGAATLNGIPTKVFESGNPQVKVKAWVEEKYGLIVRLMMISGSGAEPQTMMEVKELSLAKPAPAVFALPPACAEAARAPRTPTQEERIAADTGGSAKDFANAILGPASKNSCTAVLKVVRAGSLEPLGGFQVALDTTLDLDHPARYIIGIASNGRNTFSGGGLHEVTGQMRNGQLRIENVPSAFQIELTFGKAGDASALIYRQCFAPQTTLLFVVKNPDKLSDGGHWLWSKSGQ